MRAGSMIKFCYAPQSFLHNIFSGVTWWRTIIFYTGEEFAFCPKKQKTMFCHSQCSFSAHRKSFTWHAWNRLLTLTLYWGVCDSSAVSNKTTKLWTRIIIIHDYCLQFFFLSLHLFIYFIVRSVRFFYFWIKIRKYAISLQLHGVFILYVSHNKNNVFKIAREHHKTLKSISFVSNEWWWWYY